MNRLKCWIEAMRLRTLPVSTAGVAAGVAYCVSDGCFLWAPSLICLIFALLAQIASNFANEYYDFKNGLDRAGREGPRRGVTEGDISPNAMKMATYLTIAAACVLGLSLICWGGWQLIFVGALIAVGVVAYSSGPYPLSHHALGEVAVVFFFGIIPVIFTYYIQSREISSAVALGSIAVGLMGANVLLVNNYRDADDDRAVGKTTIAVKYGRKVASALYLANGIVAAAIMAPQWTDGQSAAWLAVPVLYIILHLVLWIRINRVSGAKLNPMLGATSMLMLLYSLTFLAKSTLSALPK